MAGFVLPEAPGELAGKPVRAWSAPVVIPTYEPMPADKNPMFLERRVYQGSSGRVYPLAFVDRISTEKKDRAWQAIHIENEYVRLMILPELGGRIHVGLDKTVPGGGYDFFYRQNVIKPALVGLAGPWISGGVEFNWPQHHRPSTFMPVETQIEEGADGSVTVWCSEHEPMTRMKGMHGVCLKPGSSLIELKVRLYNRTELPQTFLWWANVAVRVHEQYQSFFPPDVQVVADHAKRAMSRFPLCEGGYYGVDYGGNAERGTLNAESRYARNDLRWYGNIPVPTSYMVMGTKEDFFGGYDHFAEAGFVHVADHRIAPGKKQWTWGNHPFGYAWDRNLTDPEDETDTAPPYRRHLPAPYMELMAGVFTDNQPDFSWLMPGETRSFSQYWFPIQKIGVVVKANVEAAVSLAILDKETGRQGDKEKGRGLTEDTENTESGGRVRIGVGVTGKVAGARVELRRGGEVVWEEVVELVPGGPMVREVAVAAGVRMTELRVGVFAGDGREVIGYQAVEVEKKEVPGAAVEPGMPGEVGSVEELYLVGLHLEQYRHATRMPEAYWREGLRREPGDVRCNNALGLWHLRRGEFGKAVGCFEKAIGTLTRWNPNPREGEVFYNLGVALRYLGRVEEAYEAFGKAAWDGKWQQTSDVALAQIDFARRDFQSCYERLLRTGYAFQPRASMTRGMAVQTIRADTEIDRKFLHKFVSAYEPFSPFANVVAGVELTCSNSVRLDTALEFSAIGMYEKAIEILNGADRETNDGTLPLICYYTASLYERLGNATAASNARWAAAMALPDYCFPHRLEEIAILLDAIEKNPEDGRAPYYLGNLLYDKGRREEGISWWEKAAKLDRSFPTVWRNLGMGYFNVMKDKLAAKGAYQKAFTNGLTWGVGEGGTKGQGDKEKGAGGESEMERESPDSPGDANREIRVPRGDARVLYERDQLWKRIKEMPEARVAELEKYPELVGQRDDLTIEYCTLLNQLQRHEEALAILQGRRFQPWEGGEGMALGQWARTHVALGRKALWRAREEGGDPRRALGHFEAALNVPENLGEAWHLLQNNSELHYWAGRAAKACAGGQGDKETRRQGDKENGGRSVGYFEDAARGVGDFQGMAVKAYSEGSYWAGLALRELGREGEARGVFEGMLAYAEGLKGAEAKIDYFATSLPAMLLFEEDLEATQRQQALLIEALARHGLNGTGDRRAARRILSDLLAENPSHGLAADLLVALDWEM